jgi:hypothetical protein
MGHKQDRLPLISQLIHAVHAAVLENQIADRKRLVDKEHVRINIDRYGEGKPHEHSA